MKKVLSYVMTVLLVISVMMPLHFTYEVHGENEVIASGNCGKYDHGHYGDNVKYKVIKIDDHNERLILEGTGETAFFNSEHSSLLSGAGLPLSHAPWYSYRKDITSVEVGNGIETLAEGALCDLSAVKEITLPSSIKELGSYAFEGCTNLTSVHLNEGLEKIGYNIFNYTNVKDVCLPKTVEFMDATNFDKLGMDHVTFEEGSPLSIKNNIVYAQNGKEMVYGKPILENGVFNIPDGIEKIDDYAFEQYKSIKRVTFPDTLKEIGAAAFYGDPIEGEIVIPDSVTKIGYSVFVYANITSITIGDSIKGINTLCADCKNLVNVRLGKNLESIISGFEGCTSLKEITLPDSLKDISFYAFEGSGLTSITIPDQVTSIGKHAFQNCSQLTKVNMGKSVTEINDYAFDKSGLESIDLNEGLLTIGIHAFDQTNLKNANVTSTVTNVSPDAFPVDCEVTRTASPRTTHLATTNSSVKTADRKDASNIQEETPAASQEASVEVNQLENAKANALEDPRVLTGQSVQETKDPQESPKVKTSYLPLTIKMKKVAKSQVKISYHKVKNAKAYAIYMAKGKGSYKLMKKQKKLNYTVKHLKKGSYHFFVEAYNKINQKIAMSKKIKVSTVKRNVAK